MVIETKDMGELGLMVRILSHIFYWQNNIDRRYWCGSDTNQNMVINDFGDLVGV